MTTEEKVLLVKKAFDRIIYGINYKVTPAPIGSWIVIEFEPLDVDSMERVCLFIRHYFSATKSNGLPKYMHKNPKFTKSQSGYPALVFDENDVERIFGHVK